MEFGLFPEALSVLNGFKQRRGGGVGGGDQIHALAVE